MQEQAMLDARDAALAEQVGHRALVAGEQLRCGGVELEVVAENVARRIASLQANDPFLRKKPICFSIDLAKLKENKKPTRKSGLWK
jgi:hypothetical protein